MGFCKQILRFIENLKFIQSRKQFNIDFFDAALNQSRFSRIFPSIWAWPTAKSIAREQQARVLKKAQIETLGEQSTIPDTVMKTDNPSAYSDSIFVKHNSHAPLEISNLSRREIDVLKQLADGMTSKEVSSVLDISHHTVNFHLRNAISKLNAKNKTAAVARAIVAGCW